jgi:hypothetical protein
MKRQHQLLLIGALLGFSWLAMQIVHELGHVAAAWVSGGQVAEVKLHPLEISYTVLAKNPRPLFVAWMGPLIGVALPMLAWWLARRRNLPAVYILRFFAGFCLVANGAYLAAGSIYEIGDAGDLLRFGTPAPIIWLYGLITFPSGLWLWNGLGPHFGFGNGGEYVDRYVAYVVTLLLFMIIALELAFAG